MAFLDEHTGKIVGSLLSLMVAGFVAFFRIVFTNKKRLDLLEQRQELQHAQMVEKVDQVKDAVTGVQETNKVAIETQVHITALLEEMHKADRK